MTNDQNNNMNDDKSDEREAFEARLTAYALGEVEGEELAQIEARLADDADAARHVEEVRATADLLTKEFAAEPTIGLTDDQRAHLERRMSTDAPPALKLAGTDAEPPGPPALRSRHRRRLWWMSVGGVGLAAAAGFAIMVTVGPWSVDRASGPQYAINSEGDGDAARDAVSAEERIAAAPAPSMDSSLASGVDSRLSGPPRSSAAAPKRSRGEVAAATGSELAGRGDSGVLRRNQPDASSRQASTGGFTGMVVESDVDDIGRPAHGDSRFLADEDFNTEDYDRIIENSFHFVDDQPLSTLSIDVDTASYADVRRYLNQGRLPRPDAVRIEEMINYFSYDYEPPSGDVPFSTNLEVGPCPWNAEHRLVRIGLKGRTIPADTRPATNLVFLLDVSGSMDQPNKLPLVKQAMKMLVNNLTVDDRISIVVYSGAAGTILPPTYCSDRQKIIDALEQLQAGGSTHGSAGIKLAYELAEQSFIEGGVNRVILCTDGDLNVGVTSDADLERLIEAKRKTGVFLSVLAFGTGNTKFSKMEKLADKGNGNYAYIDSIHEARKVLVEEMGGTLVTIAKDVKIQIEFNPGKVNGYRLIGYENRLLRAEDFNDDTKDAGEIGAGHTVTALYEIVPVGVDIPRPEVDELKYQEREPVVTTVLSDELLTVKLRYKEPDGDTSSKLEFPLKDRDDEAAETSDDFRFAAAVASFGMVLRDSQYRGDSTFDTVIDLATGARGEDASGYRTEFVQLVKTARALKGEH